MIKNELLLLYYSNLKKIMFKLPNNQLLTETIFNDAAMPKYSLINQPTETANTLIEVPKAMKPEEFSFTINTANNTITDMVGISQWLGYDATRFTLKNFLNILHPAHAIAEAFYTIALYHLFAEEKISHKERLGLTYVSLLALQHKNGKYIYCKKEVMPIHIGTDGRVAIFNNICSIVKDFNNEHYSFRIYNEHGLQTEIEEKTKTLVKYWFEKKSGFSVQELRILKRYATTPDITSEMVANSFRIEKSTVSTYNKRILNKAENIFEYRFDNAQKVAEYFNSMYLI